MYVSVSELVKLKNFVYFKEEIELIPGIVISLMADSTRSLKIKSSRFCKVVVTLRFMMTRELLESLEVLNMEVIS